MKSSSIYVMILITLVLVLSGSFCFADNDAQDLAPLPLTLAEAIDLALQNQPALMASEKAVEAAQAQHKQALSTYWPSLNATGLYSWLDEDPVMIYPASKMVIPPMDMGGFVFRLPSFPVPEQKIKLMDQENLLTSVNLSYPVYTGGLLSSLRQQAKYNIEINRQKQRKTELEVIHNVKKYYYSALLAREILSIGQEALTRLEVTLSLTENLYQKGSGRVKKTDYLKSKVIVENVRALVTDIQSQSTLALAALVHAIGLPWNQPVIITEKEIPFMPLEMDLQNYIAQVYAHNPDWALVKAALVINQAQIQEAQSGYLPKLAITGSLNYIINDYDYGIVNNATNETWSIGLGLQVPLFNGFRTANKIKEAKANYEKLQYRQIELEQGLALQIHYLFLKLATARQKETSLLLGREAAVENQQLTESAYQIEMVDEQDLIESQIMASFSQARYLAVLLEYFLAQSELELVIGCAVDKAIND
ncbi:MAG TPA: TolC family protein [bacterium]|nr:TolC family protein [bacterium]HPN44639.1 TolC family protein [bacterium]